MSKFTGLKVFSATQHRERAVLGETITEWIARNPGIEIVDTVITQSSDNEFHCLAITIFYKGVLSAADMAASHATTNGSAPRRLEFKERR